MRSKVKLYDHEFFTERYLNVVLAILVVLAAVLSLSCSGDQPLTAEEFSSLESSPKGTKSPRFVVIVDKQFAHSRPFLAPPGVCTDIGPDGGTITSGPVKLIIPQYALGETTEICISSVNQNLLIAEFSPAGLTFSVDATMEWDLTGSSAEDNADNVTTIWYNPVTQLWEEIVTEPPIDPNTTKTFIEHFSKYAQQVSG